jgi:serine/threonine protein kinase
MLGPYELLEKVGQGGMGTVYKARHTRLKKIVALKVLAPSLIGNEEAQARFDREMEAVGKIDHPNIVRALDAGEFGGLHYLSMEYVEGTDLNQLVRERGPLSVANACQVIRQAAQGLAVAHEAGLVHRDIKPANILLANDGRVKLLDLGLARIGESDTKNQFTGSGQTFGTADYMAPEQCEDSHKVDARADLYSLGCTLYFLLTGKPPYATAQTFPAKILAHVSWPMPDLSSACPDAPLKLVSLYQKLMAKSPAQRIASAWEVVSLLTPLAGEKAPADLVQMPLAERPKRTTKRAVPIAAWLLASASIAIAIFSIVILTRQAGTTPDVRHDDRGGTTDTSASSDSAPVDLLPIDYVAERKAAEWLAQRMTDGFFMVEVGSGQWKPIT